MKMSDNSKRWLLSLALGFFGGVCQCASDTQPQGINDYVRHGFIGLAPAIACLKITLDRPGM